MKIKVLLLTLLLTCGLGSLNAAETQEPKQDPIMSDLLDVEAKYPSALIESLFYLCRQKVNYFGAESGKNIDVDFYCALKVVNFLK